MPSTFFGLNIALQALQAHQRALDVINHNIANMHTPGYSRQEPILAAQLPAPLSAHNQDATSAQVGAGVGIEEVRRYTSALLTRQARREKATLGRWEVIHGALQELESVFNEPSDTAINAALSAFWAAWEDLSHSPESASNRANLRQVASYLTGLFRGTHERLANLRWDLDGRVARKVEEINDLAREIHQLNTGIHRDRVLGGFANDLQDRRDLALDRLSQIVDIAYVEDSQGKITVTIGGRTLVNAEGYIPLTTARDPLNDQMTVVKWTDDDIEVRLTQGELKGIQEARDQVVPARLDALDELAAELIAAVNAQHQLGYNLDDETGVDFLTGTGARDMALSAPIEADLDKIAAATATESPGDGGNALVIGQLQEELLMGGGETTLGDFYRAMISQLGLDAREASMLRGNAEILLEDLEGRKAAETGVSLDEEVIDLIRYQRAYQAAARVITALDEMLEIVVNRLGLVGR